MLSYILPTIGFAILLIAVIMAIRNRFNTSKCFSCLMVGIFFTALFMLLPTQWLKEGTAHYSEPMYIFVSSLEYCFDIIKGKPKIAQFETLDVTGIFKSAYMIISYAIAIIAPIMTSSLIVSFFGNTGDKIQYSFRFSKKCHVFSQLNENSLALAKGIKKNNKKDTIVFCNTKSADKIHIESAKKLGGILLYKTCENISPCFRHKSYSYYLITDDEDKNTNTAITLIHKLSKKAKPSVTINTFAHSNTNIKVVEKMKKGNIKVRLIDEINLFCNQLLYTYPLFDSATMLPDGNRLISVALIGAGRTGISMLKAITWCGQIYKHKLKIRMYDKNADAIKEEFALNCPELCLPEYDIRFIETDAKHASFSKHFLEQSNDTTYVVVAMGDDDLNTEVADTLFSIFRKQNRFSATPPVFARVRSGIKGKNLSDNKYLTERNIHLFGNIDTIYSDHVLFNTMLEKRALAVHLSYDGVLNTKKDQEKSISGFLSSEYKRRSSMAVAVHIDAKLHGKKLMEEEGLSQDEITDRLAYNEHIRWMAFMRSEGYCTTDSESMKIYAPMVEKNRDDLSKLHPCITDWDKLDSLSAEYNKLGISEKQEDFKKSDYDIVKNMPEILRVSEKL